MVFYVEDHAFQITQMCVSHLFPVGTLTIYFHLTLRVEKTEDRGDSGHTHEYKCVHSKPESQYIKEQENRNQGRETHPQLQYLTSRKGAINCIIYNL